MSSIYPYYAHVMRVRIYKNRGKDTKKIPYIKIYGTFSAKYFIFAAKKRKKSIYIIPNVGIFLTLKFFSYDGNGMSFLASIFNSLLNPNPQA